MISDKLRKLEADRLKQESRQLVRAFKKEHEKGEFRNKLGRWWWPLWNRVVVPVIATGVILTGGWTGVIAGAALWSASHPFTKGFSINVQNIAIKNAALFGREMKQRQIPEDVRRQAIREYLNQSGAWFFNKAYVKKNGAEIDRMAAGQVAKGINNLVALAEYNLTRQANYHRKRGRVMPVATRVKIYQQSYATYRAERSNDMMALAQKRGQSR